MKVPVTRSVTEEAEIELPMYGSWEDDVSDGRLYWETRFLIDDKLTLHTVSRYGGERSAWESSTERLKPEQVGQYLGHERITSSEFRDFAQHIVALFIDLGDSASEGRLS